MIHGLYKQCLLLYFDENNLFTVDYKYIVKKRFTTNKD